MIVHIVREGPPVTPVTRAGSGAMVGARPGSRPVSGARAGEGQGAGVHCAAVKNISEPGIVTAGATTCYLLVLLKMWR